MTDEYDRARMRGDYRALRRAYDRLRDAKIASGVSQDLGKPEKALREPENSRLSQPPEKPGTWGDRKT